MREVEQLQTIFICCVVIGIVFLGIGLYQLHKAETAFGELEHSLNGMWAVVFAFMLFVIAALVHLNKVSMETRIHEIEKIEATLETGNLYYNGKQILADDMTPEQIYSDFSYAITEDGVHVYAR